MSADEIGIGQFSRCDAYSEFSQGTYRSLIYIYGVVADSTFMSESGDFPRELGKF